MSTPSSGSSTVTASPGEGEERKGSLSFADDYDYRDVQIIKDAMAVANDFIAGKLFIEAVLASLIPLADCAELHPSRPLARGAVVAQLTRRLLNTAERAQLTTHLHSIVSRLHAKVVSGTTDFLMQSELYADSHFFKINVEWVKSLKDNTFTGANHSSARAMLLPYHSTLLIIKFISQFCHGLTHFLVEFVSSMDKSAYGTAAAAPAASTSSTSQQKALEVPPTSPQLEGLSRPRARTRLRHTPKKMGTRLIQEVRRGPLSTAKKRSVLEGDFGVWIEEVLFGFRLSCSPPSPHKLSRLIGIRPLANGQQVHYEITVDGAARITAASLSAAAKEADPSLTCLHLTHADGHIELMEPSVNKEPVEELDEAVEKSSSKCKRGRFKKARMVESRLSESFAEEEEQESSHEELPWFNRYKAESEDDYIVSNVRVKGKELKRGKY